MNEEARRVGQREVGLGDWELLGGFVELDGTG